MSQMFTRNNTSEYFEGLDTLSQDIYHYSEVGNTAETLVKLKGEEIIYELTTLMDGLPYAVDMAFEGKGKNYAQPGLIIIDTNNPEMNAKYTLFNVAALFRRFTFIEPVVKRQMRYGTSMQLDVKASLESKDAFMDKWEFRIKTYSAVDVQNPVAQYKYIIKDGKAVQEHDIYELTDVVFNMIFEHFQKMQEVHDASQREDAHVEFYLHQKDHISVNENEIFDEKEVSPEENAESILKLSKIDMVEWAKKYEERKKRKKLQTEGKLLDGFKNILNDKTIINKLKKVPFEEKVIEKPKGYKIEMLYNAFRDTTSYIGIKTVALALKFGNVSSKKVKEWGYGKNSKYLHCTSIFSMMVFYNPIILLPLITLFIAFNVNFSFVETPFVNMGLNFSINSAYNAMIDSWDTIMEKEKVKHFAKWWKDNEVWIVNITAAVSSLALTYQAGSMAYSYLFKKDKEEISYKVTEASNFKIDSVYNDKLLEKEAHYHAGKSYKRIFVKGTDNMDWNLMQGPSLVVHKGDPKSLESSKHLRNNVRRIMFNGKLGPYDQHLFGVKGDIALINRHAFKTFPIEISVSCNGNIKNTEWKNVIITKDLYEVVSDDLAVIRVNGLCFGDMTAHFMQSKYLPDFASAYIAGDPVMAYKFKPINVMDSELGNITINNVYTYSWKMNSKGYCGTPLVGECQNGSTIFGLHCAGDELSPDGFADIVDKDNLEAAMLRLINKSGLMQIHSQGALRVETHDIHRKSAFNYEKLSGLDLLGSTGNVIFPKGVSKVTSVPCRLHLESLFEKEFNFVTQKHYGAPVMQAQKDNGVWNSPFNNALKKMSVSKIALDRNILKKCVKKYTAFLSNAFGDCRLSPLDMESVINGLQDDFYTRRMNVHTSAGFGWDCLKSDIVPIVSDDEFGLHREPNDDIKKLILEIMETYDQGRTCRFIVRGALKDEPREREKIKECKTRLFYVSPIEYVIISKMFLSPFYTHLLEHGSKCYSSIGINIYVGANNLMKRLKRFNNVMEGDYSGFDQNIPYEIKLAAATVVYNILEEKGYNKAALNIVQGLLTDGLFPVIELLGDLFEACGVQPSGMFATAENNTLIGVLLVMYVWYYLFDDDFFEHVQLEVYGDDILMTVSELYKDKFNNVIYAAMCKKLFGMTFTSAQKDGKLAPFVTFETMSYLKRKFVWSNEFQRYIAPIDMESIYKMLTLYIPSKTVSFSEQYMGAIQSALVELFFHCNKEHFERIRDNLIDMYTKTCFVNRQFVENKFKTRLEIQSMLGF